MICKNRYRGCGFTSPPPPLRKPPLALQTISRLFPCPVPLPAAGMAGPRGSGRSQRWLSAVSPTSSGIARGQWEERGGSAAADGKTLPWAALVSPGNLSSTPSPSSLLRRPRSPSSHCCCQFVGFFCCFFFKAESAPGSADAGHSFCWGFKPFRIGLGLLRRAEGALQDPKPKWGQQTALHPPALELLRCPPAVPVEPRIRGDQGMLGLGDTARVSPCVA